MIIKLTKAAMNISKKLNNINSSGFVLPLFLIGSMMVIVMLIAVAGSSQVNNKVANIDTLRVSAQLAADGGLDKAIIDLTADSNYSGTSGQIVVQNANNIKTTYQTVVTNVSTTQKTITVTARAFKPANATVASSTRKYEVDVSAVTSGSAGGSVVSGVGGLTLSANAKISGGDVIVNGKVTLANNAQIGLSTNPINLRVAHQSCPVPVTAIYPQVCGSGNGQPITMGINSVIYGNVQATNQTTGTNMSNPGLIAGSSFPPVALPAYDRAAQKTAATNIMTAAAAGCSNNGSVTWPANTKIIGSPSFGNNCTINIQGNVWVTGSLSLSNNARIVVPSSVGTTRPVVMVDGSAGFVLGNNGYVTPNSSNTGIQVITFWSADSSCSPDCTSVTGVALATSQTTKTIDLSNNGSAQYSVLYAYWSLVSVSNNGALGAVAGQTIQLSNNAVISFTASVPGSNNQIVTWVKRGYMRVYN